MCDYVSGVSLQSKIFIGNKGDIAQFSAHLQVPLAIDALASRVQFIYVCVRVWPGGRVASTSIRDSVRDRNMDKQLWDSRLRVDGEAEQLIDFKHRKWKFPITTKVRAANC